MKSITFDIEASNLLNNETIDYCSIPYKLKDTFQMHCIVVEEHDTKKLIAFYDGDTYIFDGREYNEKGNLGHTYTLLDYQPIEYEHRPLGDFILYIKDNPNTKVIGHNIIDYDLLACRLWYQREGGSDPLKYSIKYNTWGENKHEFIDTLILSKTLNPDRFGGHSLDKLGKKVGLNKIEFRKKIKQEDRFKEFAADMLYYCIRDVQVNTKVYNYLNKEAEGWDWKDAIRTEHRVRDIITRQSHRGFKFDKILAERNIEELDSLMAERKERVEPYIPTKPATKGFMKDYTPPKIQFKKDGSLSAVMGKWINKVGAEIVYLDPNNPTCESIVFRDKTYHLPLPEGVPLLDRQVATIKDTTHIKDWLVGELGWTPTEYKEKDLSVKIVKGVGKVKRTQEEYAKAVKTYVEQTLKSAFCRDRCEFLGTSENRLEEFLLKKDIKKGIKVITNPSFTVGQEKEMDMALEKIAKKFPHVKDIVEYLTYSHRRNSILGGNMDWEEGEEEAEKGYLSYLRDDSRIATPADSVGTNTARMKHKEVSNIPRITSLYGENMRGLFGVEKDCYQIGYDFSSLEAIMEGHYCYPYDANDKAYCDSLTLPKPNDTHSKLARAISKALGREFERTPAKSVRYGCLPVDNSEVLTREGWKQYYELKEGQEVLTFCTELCHYVWKPIEKLWFYRDAEVIKMSNNSVTLESTADHRWYGYKRRMKGGSTYNPTRYNEKGFNTTEDFNTECAIQHAANYWNEESVITPEEASLVAWLLSDGAYKWSELSETTSSSHGKRKGITAVIHQSKNKYFEVIEEVLSKNNIGYTKDIKEMDNGNDVFAYRLRSEDIRDFLDRVVGSREQKHEVNWCEWVLRLDQPALQEFFHHFWLADGHVRQRGNSKVITQNSGNICDAIALVGNLINYKVTITNKDSSGKCKSLNFKPGGFTTGQRLKKSVSRKTNVFCITTGTGTFVTRQNGFITITGNCTYGAQIPKVAKTVGCDMQTAGIIFNLFWNEAWPLKILKDKLENYWKTKGEKKFVPGLDGRKIPTRSAHSILNSLFQSAGVICAKTTMIYFEDLLEKEGLLVDLFKDDWRDKSYVQQLIAYHKNNCGLAA